MLYDQFIGKVQEYADLDSRDDAERAIAATLETLGERISRVHRKHLAAQLPRELSAYVLKRHETERYLQEEFLKRVAARAELRFHDALRRARAVLRTLREAVSEG